MKCWPLKNILQCDGKISLFGSLALPESMLAIIPFSSVKTLGQRNLPLSTSSLALPVHSLRGS